MWAQKELPYSYGFENNNLAGEGWTVENGYNYGTGEYARTDIYSSAAKTGSYGFRFYAYSGYSNQILISPELTAAAVDVSFYYKSTGTTATQEFYVGYSTTNTESFSWGEKISYKETTWKEYQTTFPSETKYIAIKYISDTQYTNLYIDDISISISTPYKTPTDFALSSFTSTSATFSWTAGNSETNWQIAYSTSSTFTPGTDGTTLDITANPYELTDLKTKTTYYAAIRANYGGGNFSEWTDKVSFTPSDEVVTDVNNTSTTTNQNVIINGNSVKSNLTRSQFIIPSAKLSDVNGRQITKLKFYSSTSSTNYQNWGLGGAEFEVYLKEVSSTTYSSTTMSDWGTKVYNSGTLSVSDYAMEITLNTPYNYNGGNLQVGIKQTTKASDAKYFPWVVVTGSIQSARYSTDSGSANYATANPKVTITTVSANTAPVQIDANGYTTFASPYPLDLTAATQAEEGLTAYRATVDAENSKVLFTSGIDQNVSANTGVLLAGTPGETYLIPVAVSGTALTSNDFLVNEEDGTFDAESGYTYYALKKNSSPLIFGTFDPSTVVIPSNKAYVKVATGGGVKEFTCEFENATAVQGIKEAQPAVKGAVYDLSGRRVANAANAQLPKGLYIIDGKKVVIK